MQLVKKNSKLKSDAVVFYDNLWLKLKNWGRCF